MKKVIFMGTPEFSTGVLKRLIEDETVEVIAVVTQPDRAVGRKKIITPTPVKVVALEHDIPVYQPEKLSGSQELEELMQLDADLIVTAAYGQFLPTKFLNFPRFGAVNVHASLLPKYRGGAPIHYAIMNGDKETGVTIMRMVAKMDAGAIISQRAIPITGEDDVASMFEKLSVVGADLLIETLPALFAGTITEVEQDEALVSFSPNISREQEQIDWNKIATEVDCFVRGLRPWPTSFTILNGNRVKMWGVALTDKQTAKAPGSLFVEGGRLYVACGSGTVLEITRLQPAGKAQMDAKAFMNGFSELLKDDAIFEGLNHE